MSMKIEGGKELEQALSMLPEKVAQGFMRDALMAGAGPVLEAAQQASPVGETGALRDGLNIAVVNKNTVVVQTGQGNRAIQATLKRIGRNAGRAAGGGKQGYKTAAGKAAWSKARKAAEAALEAKGISKSGRNGWQGQYYGSILEHGFKHGKTNVAPRPWMERALESSQSEATDEIAQSLRTSIESEGFKL